MMQKTTLPKLSAGKPAGLAPRHEQLTLERRSDGLLSARISGEMNVVHVRRCFPWTEPGRFISLRDDEGNEVAFVTDVTELNENARRVLEDALAAAGFIFDVTAVLEIDEEVELRHWRVQTRQGSRRFQTRLDDWPRKLPDGSLLIRDVTGDFYRVSDPARLDEESR
jgi:hypothetical protein